LKPPALKDRVRAYMCVHVWSEATCENQQNIARASNITLELCTTWFILLLDLRTSIVSCTIAGTEVVVIFLNLF